MFVGVGSAIASSVAKGITDGEEDINRALKELLSIVPPTLGIANLGIPNPEIASATKKAMYMPHTRMMAPAVINRNVNVTFGDVYLQNGMDMAVFKEQVRKVILEG